MATFVAAFAVMLLAAAGLGIGWLVKGQALKGTCASMNVMSSEPCQICGGQPSNCTQENSGA